MGPPLRFGPSLPAADDKIHDSILSRKQKRPGHYPGRSLFQAIPITPFPCSKNVGLDSKFVHFLDQAADVCDKESCTALRSSLPYRSCCET